MIGKGIISYIKQKVDDIKTVIGSLTDYVAVPYVSNGTSLRAYAATNYYHAHGASFVYPKYVAPVTLTSAIASWLQQVISLRLYLQTL